MHEVRGHCWSARRYQNISDKGSESGLRGYWAIGSVGNTKQIKPTMFYYRLDASDHNHGFNCIIGRDSYIEGTKACVSRVHPRPGITLLIHVIDVVSRVKGTEFAVA